MQYSIAILRMKKSDNFRLFAERNGLFICKLKLMRDILKKDVFTFQE